ncbi:MAG: hypothetical protein AAF383_09840 [Cyanobacteria bacterium P01_A01_bin.83]
MTKCDYPQGTFGDGNNPSRNEVWVSDDFRVDLERGYLLNNGERLKIGQDIHEQVLVTYFNPKSEQANPKTTMAN